MIQFQKGFEYTLKSGTSESTFTGKVIDRSYNLGRCLSGKDGNGVRCHLTFDSIQKHNWTITSVSNNFGRLM